MFGINPNYLERILLFSDCFYFTAQTSKFTFGTF